MNNKYISLLDNALTSIRKVYSSIEVEQQVILEDAIAHIVFAKNFIAEPPSKKNQEPRQFHSNRNEILIVSIFLSKFGHQDLYNTTQTQALHKIADILGVKFNYLKGTRDIFDQFFDNGRKGWVNRPLKESEESIFNKYKSISKESFLKEVNEILKIEKGGKTNVIPK